MIDHIHALPEGYELEEYTITGTLGYGGFGITYSAHDKNLDKIVAIKEYLPSELAVRVDGSTVSAKSGQEQANFNWGLERFLDEARTVAKFDHENVVHVYRFFEQNSTGYIVMEFIQGQTLDAFLKEHGTLEEPELRRWLWPIMSGLKVVHQAGYLHRDIKPQNIMMQANGHPCLLDFGAARLAMGGMTRSLTSIMTPGFAPLEQYQSKGQGPWTDIYALGAVMYMCISGTKPQNALDRVSHDTLEPPDSCSDKSYSTGLIKGITAALTVSPGERPQSLDELLQILESSNDATTILSPGSADSQPTPDSETTRLSGETTESGNKPANRKLLLVTISILLIAAAIGYWFAEIKPEPITATDGQGPSSSQAEAPADPIEIKPEEAPQPIEIDQETAPEPVAVEVVEPEIASHQGLNVNSVPAGAGIFIDGAYAGDSPLQIMDLAAGQEVSLRIESRGFQTLEQVVRVPPDGMLDINWSLDEAIEQYALTIKTTPRDARVSLLNIAPEYEDGVLLEPGKYQVRISAKDFKTDEQWVEIKDSAVVVDIELPRTEQWLRDQYLNERDREEREKQERAQNNYNNQKPMDQCQAQCASLSQNCLNSIPRCDDDEGLDCTASSATSIACAGDPNCLRNSSERLNNCQQQAQIVRSQCIANRNIAIARCESGDVARCLQSCR